MECNTCTVVLPGPSLASGCPSLSLFLLVLEQFLRTQCDIEDPCHQIIPCHNPRAEYDFIVVGGGSAGSVVASRLSEIADWKVVLVEAGCNEPTLSQVPSMFESAQRSSVDWQYFTEPESTACLSTAGSCFWPRGKVIGGTSVINKMYYVRGNCKDYDNWERLGNKEWAYKDVLPYFLKSEDNNLLEDSVDQEYHRAGGYLPVRQSSYHYPIEKDILQGVRELGLEVGDFNGKCQTRFAQPQITARRGIRYSTSRAFLRLAQGRPNLHILLNTTVTRVLVHPGTKHAYGVEVITTEGYKRNILATKEVILSGGAINSPQLLLLSGIGDEKQLKKVNVTAVHHNPGVGRNLLHHIGFLVNYHINETNINCLNWATAMEYLMFRTGPLSTSGPNVIGFIQTKYANTSEDYPDVQIQFNGYPAKFSKTGMVGETNGGPKDVDKRRTVGFSASLHLSRSIGYLRLRDNNPLSHPKIYPKYLTAPQDMATLIEGIKFSLILAQTNALKKYMFELDRTPAEGCEDKPFGSDEYWRCAIRTDTFLEHHHAGTCKMGPDSDPQAVVDPQLRVRGVSGLRVVDSSTIPVLPRANTNAPTIMIAEKASDMIKQQYLDSYHVCE